MAGDYCCKLSTECLALHLGVEKPLDDLRISHGPADEPPTERTEEELEDMHLVLHLTELLGVGLAEAVYSLVLGDLEQERVECALVGTLTMEQIGIVGNALMKCLSE